MGLTDKLVSIADSIRAKTGGTDPLTLDEMATAIEGIETGGGGDTTIEDGLVSGTLTEYTNNRVKGLNGLSFASNRTIVSVSFENVTGIKKDLFNGATNLQSVSFPSATSVGQNAFYNCKALTSVNIPSLIGLGGSDFYGCTSLVSVSFPQYNQANSGNNFKGCSALKVVDLGSAGLAQSSANFILPSMFENCSVFDTLIIRHTANVRVMSNTSAFKGTPFAEGGTGGTIYVPQTLLESYQTSTNWAALLAMGACTFLPIEGSEYE